MIRGDEAQITQWQPPHVHRKGETPVRRGARTADRRAKLDDIQKAAHDEGFGQGAREGMSYGHREGLEKGRADVSARIERLDQALKALDKTTGNSTSRSR